MFLAVAPDSERTSETRWPRRRYATNEVTASPRSTFTRANDTTYQTTLDTFDDQQSNVLSHKALMIVFPAIALAQFTSYLDQTAISTALPAIANGLKTGTSSSWIGTSFLVASASVQLLNGRLSDIFGRKEMLLLALSILAVGNLVTGFSQVPAMLFALRAFSGLGAGAMLV